MKKKVALIHTGFALVEILTGLFNKIIPDAELVHIVDDSLLREVLVRGKVTKPVIKRMLSYYRAAEDYNVDVIFNVCSSVGEVADIAREIIDTPIVKIDDKMAGQAVARATNIGVAATLQTTLDPTCRLIEAKAKSAGKKINIKRTLCPGAFEELMAGNSQKHDRIVLDGVAEIARETEVVVFAQGSMARLKESLDDVLAKKVLTSPESGIVETKQVLGL